MNKQIEKYKPSTAILHTEPFCFDSIVRMSKEEFLVFMNEQLQGICDNVTHLLKGSKDNATLSISGIDTGDTTAIFEVNLYTGGLTEDE